MDAFASYDNTLGFFIGNEVIALANQSLAAPYVKAAARDLKAYRDSKNYRNIPVGYSAADIAELRPMLQNYLACGSNASERIDIFGTYCLGSSRHGGSTNWALTGLNAYEWCGDNTMQTSGYDTLNGYAQGYNIPIFFSETGCNTVKPRTFQDQSAIFGSQVCLSLQSNDPQIEQMLMSICTDEYNLVRRYHLRMDSRNQRLRPDLIWSHSRPHRHWIRHRSRNPTNRNSVTRCSRFHEPAIPMGDSYTCRCRFLGLQSFYLDSSSLP